MKNTLLVLTVLFCVPGLVAMEEPPPTYEEAAGTFEPGEEEETAVVEPGEEPGFFETSAGKIYPELLTPGGDFGEEFERKKKRIEELELIITDMLLLKRTGDSSFSEEELKAVEAECKKLLIDNIMFLRKKQDACEEEAELARKTRNMSPEMRFLVEKRDELMGRFSVIYSERVQAGILSKKSTFSLSGKKRSEKKAVQLRAQKDYESLAEAQRKLQNEIADLNDRIEELKAEEWKSAEELCARLAKGAGGDV